MNINQLINVLNSAPAKVSWTLQNRTVGNPHLYEQYPFKGILARPSSFYELIVYREETKEEMGFAITLDASVTINTPKNEILIWDWLGDPERKEIVYSITGKVIYDFEMNELIIPHNYSTSLI